MRACPGLRGRGKSWSRRRVTLEHDTEYLRQATSAVLFLEDEISVPHWAAEDCTTLFVTPQTLTTMEELSRRHCRLRA